MMDESQQIGTVLVRKKPNLIWMLATLVFLAATLLELYGLTTTPIPTPAQMASTLAAGGDSAFNINMTALGIDYTHAKTSRGYYEIGAAVISLILGGMTAKNVYMKFNN